MTVTASIFSIGTTATKVAQASGERGLTVYIGDVSSFGTNIFIGGDDTVGSTTGVHATTLVTDAGSPPSIVVELFPSEELWMVASTGTTSIEVMTLGG